MTRKINDPGYGTLAGSGSSRIVTREGLMNVRRIGTRFDISDIYHHALTTSWTRFMLLSVALYTAVNSVFALAYLVIGIEHIKGAEPGSWIHNFGEAMFLSAQTLTTVGYGILSPGTPLMSSIAAIESMFGLLIFGMFTGMAFGRFSRIRPRFLYTEKMIIAPYKEGVNALMVRVVNERSSAIMDARASLVLAVELVEDGRLKRQFYDLSLEIAQVRSLGLSWTLVHPITPESPLFTLISDPELTIHAEALLVIHAYDETVGQPFYSRKSWQTSDVLVGHKFKPMFHDTPDGVVELDLSLINETIPADLFLNNGEEVVLRTRPS